MAFGVRFTLALALVSYLCTRLKMIGFLIRCTKPYNRFYGEHLLYAWFEYHCRSLQRLGDQEGLLFYRAITIGTNMGLSFIAAKRVVSYHKSYNICKRQVVVLDL